MKTCPACKRCYEDVVSVCFDDHTVLVTERPGTCLLVGTYRLECLLGRGDKGTAYEATDMDLDSPIIAVELNGTKVIDDPQEMKNFHREARQVVRAGGQDVADIYDYGPLPNGGAYVVMERIERDSRREESIAKSPLTLSPTTEKSIAPPNDHEGLSSEAARVESKPTAAESTEDETITSPLRARAAGDAMARLTDEETITFRVPKTATHRDTVTDNVAPATGRATTPQEPSLAAPPSLPPPTAATAIPAPSANSDRSVQLPSPIVVEVPGGSSEREHKSHRPLLYLGLAAAAAISVAAVWLAFKGERAPSPSTPIASVASPATEAPTTPLPTANPPATELSSPASTRSAPPAITFADNPPPVMKTRRRAADARANSPRVVLGQTLNEWIAATIRRDIEGQMSFYMPALTIFYRRSGVRQDYVREEKNRLFAEAPTVDVSLLGEPQITFSEGGRVATMRVLLSEVTEGEGQNRTREVVRELRWRKTDEGWKIFSERDL